MLRKRTIARILRWFSIAAILAVTAGAFYWSYELSHEVSILERAEELMRTRRLGEAEKDLASLAQRPLARFRSYLGIEYPLRYLWVGVTMAETGEYERAVKAFGRVSELCDTQFIRWQYSYDFCRKLQAQMHFRSGEAVLRRMKALAYGEAVEFYKKGLLLDPDDSHAKRMLDWLLVQQELYEKMEKKEGGAGRGYDPFGSGYTGDHPGGGPGTGKERKGY